VTCAPIFDYSETESVALSGPQGWSRGLYQIAVNETHLGDSQGVKSLNQ